MKQKILAGAFVFIVLGGLLIASFTAIVRNLTASDVSTPTIWKILGTVYFFWSLSTMWLTVFLAIQWAIRDKKKEG